MKVLSLVTMLVFINVIAGGTILETLTVMKYFERNHSDYQEREAMKEVLDSIVKKFDDLVTLDIDDELSPVLDSIRNKYTCYNLVIKDISSGCNLNFLPGSVLSEPSLANFLFADGNAERFLRFRANRGFDTDIIAWEPFLKEEALAAVVCYGWFSTLHKDNETGQKLAAAYGCSEDGSFPIMNDMPLININTMDPALIAPLLSLRSWRIPGAAAKATALKNRLEQGPVSEKELMAFLALRENHEIFRYLGVRTSFWALSFKNNHYQMDAIIAAVPEHGGKSVTRYVLIEGRLSRAV